MFVFWRIAMGICIILFLLMLSLLNFTTIYFCLFIDNFILFSSASTGHDNNHCLRYLPTVLAQIFNDDPYCYQININNNITATKSDFTKYILHNLPVFQLNIFGSRITGINTLDLIICFNLYSFKLAEH